MADVCGLRHDSLDESPKGAQFQNPTCASGDAIDFAGKKANVMARVGTHPWDGTKLPRGAVSKDGGATWTPFKSEPQNSNGSGSVAVTADGSVVFWAAKDAKAARSTDAGVSWTPAKGLPDPVKVADWSQSSFRVAADRVNAKKLYAFDATEGHGYVSEDGGVSFAATSRGLTEVPDYGLVVASIQTVPEFEGHVWVTGGKHLFRSNDSGQTYAPAAEVQESYAVGFGRAAPGRKYPAIYLSGKVGGVQGFFRSDDEGATFVRINDDAHQFGGSNLIIGDPRVYGRAYIAPGGRGVLYGEPAK
jgi:xyloglucan-specific exo-beta-1,4-glucanase